jgi:hypothetical protein
VHTWTDQQGSCKAGHTFHELWMSCLWVLSHLQQELACMSACLHDSHLLESCHDHDMVLLTRPCRLLRIVPWIAIACTLLLAGTIPVW